MKAALLVGVATVLLGFTARAADLYAPVQRQIAHCGDLGPTISHVSDTLSPRPMCCPDPSKCTQYLSTARIAVPRSDLHT